jgi:IS1 family transposase
VAYVWGKRDQKTAKKQGKRIQRFWISYARIATDDGDGFVSVFVEDNHEPCMKWRFSLSCKSLLPY